MFEGNWKGLKEKMKLRYPELSEEELERNDSEELFYLLSNLQKIFLTAKDEIITKIGRI
ncbi:MAG: hypothetical protein WCA84_12670 [Ignavibacteriaceae bacterium]|jgi:hypothetical protein